MEGRGGVKGAGGEGKEDLIILLHLNSAAKTRSIELIHRLSSLQSTPASRSESGGGGWGEGELRRDE